MSSTPFGLYRLASEEVVTLCFTSCDVNGDPLVTYRLPNKKLVTVSHQQWQAMATRLPTFCVFEGLDKSGKTTQAAIFAAGLREEGFEVVEIRFPDRTTVLGKLINSYLTSEHKMTAEQQHLIFAANRWEAQDSIREHLAAGKFVVCDRYLHSGVAYSMAHNCPDHLLANADKGLITPDVVFFLDISVEQALSRRCCGAQEEITEAKEFQIRVARAYPLAFAMHPCRVKTIKAGESKNVVTQAIKDTFHAAVTAQETDD